MGDHQRLEREKWMNFRTSYLVGLAAICSAAAVPVLVPQAQSEVLKVTGPNGETRQQVRQYGPTSVNDTFWSIAQKVRPDDSVSIYQVMAAIFEANPQAFTSNNYNSLERGMILLIPSKEVMAAIPVNLARNRAEQDDKSWNSSASGVTTAAAKPIAKPTPVVTPPAPKATTPAEPAKPAPKAAEPAVTSAVNAELEALRQENGQLKQQVADLQQSLASSESQREALQLQNKSLDDRFAQIEAELADTKLQLARLREEMAAQAAEAEQKAAAAQAETPAPVAEMPSDTWRNLMDNPLLLGAVTGGPALLLLLLLWLFLRRRRAAAEAQAKAQQEPLAAAAAPLADHDDELTHDELDAIHLDDEQHDSLDSLLDVDNIDLQPEADLGHDDDQMAMAQEMFIDSGEQDDAELLAADEGQSLDDLWAEAMGEQEPAPQANQSAKDDFDSLLDGVEDEPSLKDSLPDDVAAALEQDFGTDDDNDELLAALDDELGAGDTDLDADALLAELEGDLGASAQPEKAASDQIIDADELLAALEGDIEDSEEPASSVSEHTIDADELLASFAEAPAAQQQDVTADLADDSDDEPVTAQATIEDEFDLDEDLSEAIAAELEQDNDGELELDPDALLAELQAEPQPEDLSEAIAAELEDESLIEPELVEELDPDALIAELEAPEDLSDAIAAELEDEEPELLAELDPDALIAELESPVDLSDEIAAELEDADSIDETTDDFLDADALLAELEAGSSDDDTLSLDGDFGDAPSEYDELDADALLAELQQDEPVSSSTASDDDDDHSFDFSLEDELTQASDDENLDSLLAELSQEEDKKAKANKDSGFFNDLKAAPKAAAPDIDDEDLTSLSDDELLKQFSVGAPEVGSDDDSFELTLDDDEPEDTPRLTVDEALAALDSEELAKRPVKPVSDIDLAAFQKENGFIDIDRLLNDASESESEGDPYQSRDVDVGDIDSLMGDTAMVDVDDEENSVNAKLDLARAYIEIDDSDSAKVLLQEVQADGNARQQEEAANLLKDIS